MNVIKKVSALTLPAATYLSLATGAFAVESGVTLCPEGSFQGGVCQSAGFNDLTNRVLTILIIIGVFAALAFLIWGGIKWITSGGDKTKVESARGTVIGAIIGLVIVLASYFLISVAYQLVTGNPLGSFDIPSLLQGNG